MSTEPSGQPARGVPAEGSLSPLLGLLAMGGAALLAARRSRRNRSVSEESATRKGGRKAQGKESASRGAGGKGSEGGNDPYWPLIAHGLDVVLPGRGADLQELQDRQEHLAALLMQADLPPHQRAELSRQYDALTGEITRNFTTLNWMTNTYQSIMQDRMNTNKNIINNWK